MRYHLEILGRYNQCLNSKIYLAASQLSEKGLAENHGAFFGSILGTLNHIMVGDIIWLKRFAKHPSSMVSLSGVVELPDPTSLDQIVCNDFASLHSLRVWLDKQIIDWLAEITDSDLDNIIDYKTTMGETHRKQYDSLILHFFNHQTHHRGQISTLLSQLCIDIGATDLLGVIPEEANV
ncbi:MAG: putative damage-inducible protein DinB [Porticoccaceae bacterium]|jgi:uncharacterized damage-inducible protein DinB|tara:strand:- start:612 stop:1148 length:537 start_codon:yes stop_codon:yes gene_type:complete